MRTEYRRIFRNEYIEIFYNIKLFTTDTVSRSIFVCMRYIESSLKNEKYTNNGISYLFREMKDYIDHTICRHHNYKEIKEYKHSVIEKESEHRPSKPNKKSYKNHIKLFFLHLSKNCWNQNKKIWKDQIKEFSRVHKCSRSSISTKCSRKWLNHICQESKLIEVKWQCYKPSEKNDSYLFPLDFSLLYT